MSKPRRAHVTAESEAATTKRRLEAEKALATLPAEMRQLVEQGRRRGYVTYEEIQEAVPQVEHTLDEYDRI